MQKPVKQSKAPEQKSEKKLRDKKQWLRQNQQALEDYNKRIEARGVYSESQQPLKRC